MKKNLSMQKKQKGKRGGKEGNDTQCHDQGAEKYKKGRGQKHKKKTNVPLTIGGKHKRRLDETVVKKASRVGTAKGKKKGKERGKRDNARH